MPNNEILNKIKLRGYWKVGIQPLIYKKNRITNLAKCKEIIKNAEVSLRGWPYPFFNNDAQQFEDFIQVAIDFENYIEFWRLYLSGQFIHYIALREDWLDYQSMSRQDSRFATLKQGEILGFDLIVYDVTEIFEFISRLAKQGLFTDGLKLEIALNNTENRKLFIFSVNRADFFTHHKTSAKSLSYSKEINEQDALQNSQQNAFDAVLFFCDKFGWDTPNISSIRDMQQRLVERRL
jgi:hypothetical protein